jgi:hypothetical protein
MILLEDDKATVIAKALWRALGRRKALAVASVIRRIAKREDKVARRGSEWITAIEPPRGGEAWNPKVANPKSTSGRELIEVKESLPRIAHHAGGKD